MHTTVFVIVDVVQTGTFNILLSVVTHVSWMYVSSNSTLISLYGVMLYYYILLKILRVVVDMLTCVRAQPISCPFDIKSKIQ